MSGEEGCRFSLVCPGRFVPGTEADWLEKSRFSGHLFIHGWFAVMVRVGREATLGLLYSRAVHGGTRPPTRSIHATCIVFVARQRIAAVGGRSAS